jgi:hypothetical protein
MKRSTRSRARFAESRVATGMMELATSTAHCVLWRVLCLWES